jgi:hypothetical protein
MDPHNRRDSLHVAGLALEAGQRGMSRPRLLERPIDQRDSRRTRSSGSTPPQAGPHPRSAAAAMSSGAPASGPSWAQSWRAVSVAAADTGVMSGHEPRFAAPARGGRGAGTSP